MSDYDQIRMFMSKEEYKFSKDLFDTILKCTNLKIINIF